MRLIDADELKQSIRDRYYDNPYAIEIITEINWAPDVNAAEIIHGEWVGRRGSGGYDDYYCSVCGVYEEGTSNPKYLGNYCPNCGARMDGGSK